MTSPWWWASLSLIQHTNSTRVNDSHQASLVCHCTKDLSLTSPQFPMWRHASEQVSGHPSTATKRQIICGPQVRGCWYLCLRSSWLHRWEMINLPIVLVPELHTDIYRLRKTFFTPSRSLSIVFQRLMSRLYLWFLLCCIVLLYWDDSSGRKPWECLNSRLQSLPDLSPTSLSLGDMYLIGH